MNNQHKLHATTTKLSTSIPARFVSLLSSSSSSSPSSSSTIRHWWNRILWLLLVMAIMNVAWFHIVVLVKEEEEKDHSQQQQYQQVSLSILKNKKDFRVSKQQSTNASKATTTTTTTTAAAALVNNNNNNNLRIPIIHQSANMTMMILNKSSSSSLSLSSPQQPLQTNHHRVAGLSCQQQQQHGGPSDPAAAEEMVYWRDIPSDASFISPFRNVGPNAKYLTFEPDMGGFNNVRMAMETVVAMAHAMGRTLVLPPAQRMYLLRDMNRGQKSSFTFADFFHFDSVDKEQSGLDVITMEEFLQREGHHLRDRKTGEVSYPPNHSTKILNHDEVNPIFLWMRSVANVPSWSFDECVLVFPQQPGSPGDDFLKQLNTTLTTTILTEMNPDERFQAYIGKPTPVNASPEQRLRELIAHRTNLCWYDSILQKEPVVHLMSDMYSSTRLLVHFYAFLFFQDWKHDLWTKRFIRDHLRYVDSIQCAAARIVEALRSKSDDGAFDALHIRRGDFQYTNTRLDASTLFKISRPWLQPNTTIYVATDEHNQTFFDIFRQQYHHVYFLHDFRHLLHDVNTNYYGMIDQRIASRARTFVGTFYSSFSGYINRMRGYHAQLELDDDNNNNKRAHDNNQGRVQSYYFAPEFYQTILQEYVPVCNPIWAMEFPTGWRDLDHDRVTRR